MKRGMVDWRTEKKSTLTQKKKTVTAERQEKEEGAYKVEKMEKAKRKQLTKDSYKSNKEEMRKKSEWPNRTLRACSAVSFRVGCLRPRALSAAAAAARTPGCFPAAHPRLPSW